MSPLMQSSVTSPYNTPDLLRWVQFPSTAPPSFIMMASIMVLEYTPDDDSEGLYRGTVVTYERSSQIF